MRPALRPGLRLLYDGTRQAVLVDHAGTHRLDATTATLLARLDGLRDEAALLGEHATDAEVAAWGRLRAADVVVDVEASACLVRGTGGRAHGPLLDEATAVVAEHPGDAAERWRRRRAATVAVSGAGALTEALAGLLRRSAVGAVVDDPAHPRAALVVLTDDHEPRTDLGEALMRETRPHLVTGLRGVVGVVGPFVVPGRTPCLRCVDLTRRQADPAWAQVRDRLAAPDRTPRPPGPAAGAAVVDAAAALATSDVLAHLDGREPVTAGATARLSSRQPLPAVRAWPRHPACGCAWAEAVAGSGTMSP